MDLSRFREGVTYDVGTTLGNYLLAQGWAEPDVFPSTPPVPSIDRTIKQAGVLVVDDDEDMREILLQLLQFHGWPVHAAADGVEALDALERHRPSLILLDLAMPRMNGIQFRTAQRAHPDVRLASVPVVVVSAAADAARYKTALNAADVLVKPFEPERLLQAVASFARPAGSFL